MIWWIVLLRAAIGAGFVVTVASVAELLGPFWGGLLVSLPVSAGPAFVMLAMEQDDAFIAEGAVGGLVANAVTQVFILVIILLGPRCRWPFVLAAALGTWLLVAGLARQAHWSLMPAIALNIVTFAVFLPLVRSTLRARALHPPGKPAASGVGAAQPGGQPGGRRRWFELALRGLMVGVLVATVVTASSWMGPTMTGMAAVFPIMLTGLALVTLPRLGGTATSALFASTMRAMPGFALALIILALTARPLGAWGGLAAALAGQLGFTALLLTIHRRR